MTQQPKPPFPAQHQPKPGSEAELEPRPRYQAPQYKAAGKLAGKVAIITGGDSGIGRAVAVMFAREGANVTITHLPQERQDAAETRRAVQAEGGDILVYEGDLTDNGFCKDVVRETIRRFGQLDILVNNAAYQQHAKRIEDLPLEQWEHTFQVNMHGMFRLTKAALEHMHEGAVIINVGSITGLDGSENLLDYAASKGAVHAFTKSLARQLVERGIRVNCVAPGPVWTPLNPSDRPADEVAEFGADVAMGRPAQPEEIAPAFVFFASNADSSYITGEVLTLLGGDTRAG